MKKQVFFASVSNKFSLGIFAGVCLLCMALLMLVSPFLSFAQDTEREDLHQIFLPFVNRNIVENHYKVHFLAPDIEKLSSDARTAVISAINSSPYVKPANNDSVFLISLRLEANWALATITTADLLAQHTIDEANVNTFAKMRQKRSFRVR